MTEIPGAPTIPPGPPPAPAALLREWRWSAARGALTDPLFVATVLACGAAAAAVAGGWADALAGRVGPSLAALAVAAAGAVAAAAAAGIAEGLLFRVAENALLLTLPLPDDDLFAARAAEARWWASPLAFVLACAAAGAAGWTVGLAAGLAAGVAAPALGFGTAAAARSRGRSVGVAMGAALALGAAPGLLVAAALPLPASPRAAAAVALTWAVGLGTLAAGRSAWREGGRRAAAQPAAARPRGTAWRVLSGLLAALPAPVRVRLVRDATLLLAGASPRALLTALLALSMLPFAARDFAAWDPGEGALAWHLQWFRWLTAGGAVLSFGWGLDLMEARAPGLVLERTAPRRAAPALWASAILAFAAVFAWGGALLAVAAPGRPPYGAGRLALESAVFAASLAHFAAAFALQRFDGRRVSGAFAFLPGVLAIGVLVALALHVHPLAGLLYFAVAPGMGAQARAAWERLEVPG
ncbi:hypothetical protein L6R50_11260 [Myxococcota bacterium]|nr:hypothetical protein [Myxococcota bacterium]